MVQNKRVWKEKPFFYLVLFLLLLTAFPVSTYAKSFVKEDGYYYYPLSNGERAVGRKKISGKYYYFDNRGYQRTGWRKIDSYYYYFVPANGKKGYMVTNQTVDGIYLNSKGRATGGVEELRKLRVLVKAAKIVDSQTKPTMTKSQRRKIMFTYTIKHYKNIIISDLYDQEDWDVAYAEWIFDKEYGDCYAFAAAFGYFMNAIGYEGIYMQHSNTHAWIYWNNHFYDPHWGESFGVDITYHQSVSSAGKGKRPNWVKLLKYQRLIG